MSRPFLEHQLKIFMMYRDTLLSQPNMIIEFPYFEENVHYLELVIETIRQELVELKTKCTEK